MANTGNIIVTEKDINPFSQTYNQERTKTYQDYERCVPYTAPNWVIQSSECEVTGSYNTGYLAIVELDTNPNSSTYNTTRTRYVFDIENCQLSSGFKVIKIYGNHVHVSVVKCDDSPRLMHDDIIPLYYYPEPSVAVGASSIIIGYCVNNIYYTALQGWKYMTSVYVPSTVTEIGGNAFWGCEELPEINLPSVRTISSRAFLQCYALHKIDLGNSLTNIGNRAFMECTNLNNITLPSTVTTIGDEVFSGCSGLTSLTCMAATPPTLGTGTFKSTDNHTVSGYPTIYVPAASVNAYKTANNWSSFATHIQPIQS